MRVLTSIAALQLTVSLLTPAAFGWGLTTDLNEKWGRAQLVFPAIEKHQIKYCLKIEDPRFRRSDIPIQIEMALRLWLSAVTSFDTRSISITRVDCRDKSLNLKVVFGKEKEYPDLNAYQLPQWDNQHYYSLVKINSGYVYTKGPKSWKTVDFSEFLEKNSTDLPKVLREISFVDPKTVEAFATQLGLDDTAVFLSSYRVLIHEFGHSFGLCDTYASEFEKHCDPKHRSRSQPSSVMQDSYYFYLTGDDIEGIRELFRSYM